MNITEENWLRLPLPLMPFNDCINELTDTHVSFVIPYFSEERFIHLRRYIFTDQLLKEEFRSHYIKRDCLLSKGSLTYCNQPHSPSIYIICYFQ